jgi:exonuclease III
VPFYHDIDTGTPEGRRTAERLLALREQLDRDIPVVRNLDDTLVLATWNIREFDSRAYGERLPEAFYYIAEIINRFDLVAIQEVRQDLRALERLRDILGGFWRYVVTDVTEGHRGNKERMAFLFDSRKVRFGGLAGELVLPPVRRDDGTYSPVTQLARTPFLCGFKAGWSRFMLATVHILYGASEAEPEERVEEIRQVAQFLKERTEDATAWARNLILLGDFNIFSTDDTTMEALRSGGFIIPEALQQLPSNAPRTKHYDQIAFRVQEQRLGFTGRAGVFDFFQTVFTDSDEDTYIPAIGEAYETTSRGEPRTDTGKHRYYRTYWRTHQMSDHLPMWVELKIDYSDTYLQRKLDPDEPV